MKKISCGLIAWIGLAGAGQAAELLPINSPTFPATPIYMPPSSAAPWTGWNLGAQLGLGWIRNSAPATFGGLDATSFSEGGFARLKGGLFGGYDMLIGRYVVAGLEGDFTYGGVKAQLTNAPASVGANGELLELWDASARVRLGVLPISKVLLYATAGGAYSQYNESINSLLGWSARDRASPGYILGGGLEAAVAERWRLRAEYRLKQTFFEKTAPGAVSIGSGQVRDQSLLLGLSYHFGAP